MGLTSAFLAGGVFVLVGLLLVPALVAVRRWRRRRIADRRPDPMVLTTERAEALRSLAAAEYGQFMKRNGRRG